MHVQSPGVQYYWWFGPQDRVTKLDGYSYEQALSRYVQVYFPTVMCVD